MKIGAYQFAVSGSIDHNFEIIQSAVQRADAEGIRLLAFPECALTGYPPRSLPSSRAVNWDVLAAKLDLLQALAERYDMCIITGSITSEEGAIYNSALAFLPDGRCRRYHKRALWGWDRDNFVPGKESGVFELNGLKIGMRICYEIRFPEYFRELYREKSDLNIVLFYDAADERNPDRYDLIRAHIRTRAAENVCPILAVNAAVPFQTAPTMLCGRSGAVLRELNSGRDDLLIWNFEPSALDFSEAGRKSISDQF